MNWIKLFWIRMFCVITKEKAISLGLVHYRNVYGDEINALDCRSIWLDKKRRGYRVDSLYEYNFKWNNNLTN